MAKYSRKSVGGVFFDDFREAVLGLRRADREAAKAVTRGLRKSAIMVQKTAHRNQKTQHHPRTPSHPGAISRFANQRSAGLTLRAGSPRYPWAAVMEFGAKTANLWFRPRSHPRGGHGWRGPQSMLRNRQHKPWIGNQWTLDRKSGYVIQPAIREDLPRVMDQVADDVLKEIALYLGAVKT